MGSDTWLQRRYVGGVAVVSKLATQTAAQSVIRYMLTDHLGSTHVVANANGVTEQVMSFDVFGARRDTESRGLRHAEASSGLLTSALTLRGYTGHEQIDDVGLIHMGGRVYDPILGRFLQADPVYPSDLKMQASAGDKSALGKAVVGRFGGSKSTTANAA